MFLSYFLRLPPRNGGYLGAQFALASLFDAGTQAADRYYNESNRSMLAVAKAVNAEL